MPRRPPTIPRRRPRQQRSQDTVGCILDATARVLCAVGYGGMNTNRVARTAGVSVGSVYQYFPSKEALLAALVERHAEEMATLVKRKLAEAASAPIEVAVRTMVQAMFDAHAVDPRLHKVLMEEVPRIGKLEHVVGVERQVESHVARFLEARQGELRIEDGGAAAFVLCNAVEAVTHAAVLMGLDEPRIAALARELTDMALRYLQASERSPARRRRRQSS